MNSRNLDLLDVLTIFSVLLQVAGVQSDAQQASNNELFKELREQDNKYLEKILRNQEIILEKLAALG